MVICCDSLEHHQAQDEHQESLCWHIKYSLMEKQLTTYSPPNNTTSLELKFERLNFWGPGRVMMLTALPKLLGELLLCETVVRYLILTPRPDLAH